MKVGTKVVYASHGVCTVVRTVDKIVGRELKPHVVLKTDTGLTIILPEGTNLIRPLVSKDKAKSVKVFMESGQVRIDHSTWNRRYREFMDRLNTGNIDDTAFVYRSLIVLRETKDLSFGERKMLDVAERLLNTELYEALQ